MNRICMLYEHVRRYMNLDVRYGMARKWTSVYLISVFCSCSYVNRSNSFDVLLLQAQHYVNIFVHESIKFL